MNVPFIDPGRCFPFCADGGGAFGGSGEEDAFGLDEVDIARSLERLSPRVPCGNVKIDGRLIEVSGVIDVIHRVEVGDFLDGPVIDFRIGEIGLVGDDEFARLAQRVMIDVADMGRVRDRNGQGQSEQDIECEADGEGQQATPDDALEELGIEETALNGGLCVTHQWTLPAARLARIICPSML